MKERDLYSLPEARARLGGISHTSIYRLHKLGKLSFTKVLGRTFVSSEEIRRFVENNTAEVAATTPAE